MQSLYYSTLCMDVCVSSCMYMGWRVSEVKVTKAPTRDGRKIGKFSHRFVVATNNLTMVLAPNYI